MIIKRYLLGFLNSKIGRQDSSTLNTGYYRENSNLHFSFEMYLFIFFLGATCLCCWLKPIPYLIDSLKYYHEACLDFVPTAEYQAQYQTMICGTKLLSKSEILLSSGLIHWILIYGFQVYFIHWVSKRIFSGKTRQNIFSFIAVSSLLVFTGFHPACLRAAIALLIREFSAQKKLFWSPLQIASFSGFACLSIDPSLIQSFSLIIGWLASICFAFFLRYSNPIKLVCVLLFIFPVFVGFSVPHPIINLLISMVSRPVLFFLFPITILFCFFPSFIEYLDRFWTIIFKSADYITNIFLPIHFNLKISIVEIWAYLLILMSLFLYPENKRLKEI